MSSQVATVQEETWMRELLQTGLKAATLPSTQEGSMRMIKGEAQNRFWLPAGILLAVVLALLSFADRLGREYRAVADRAMAAEMAAETQAFCQKYASDSAHHATCASDLQVIRDGQHRRSSQDPLSFP
jgi:hypothetical protein